MMLNAPGRAAGNDRRELELGSRCDYSVCLWRGTAEQEIWTTRMMDWRHQRLGDGALE